MRSILIIVFTLVFVRQTQAQLNPDSLIRLLRKEIGQKEIYVDQKKARIEKLRSQLNNSPELSERLKFDLYNGLYHEYKTFIYDSAFRIARKLLETSYRLNDRSLIGYARVKMGFILISSGMFKETFDSLNIVDVKYLHDTTKVDYYRLRSRAYSDLIVYNKDDYYRILYREMDNRYLDSALSWTTSDSYYRYYLSSIKHIHNRNFQAAVETVNELIERHKLTYPQLAVNYYDLAEASLGLNEGNDNLSYMAMSSLSDIRAATKETAAMYTLASMLHERGDTENAAFFIRQAVDDAEYYGAQQRKVEIGSILPLIASAELNDSETRRTRWLAYGIGLTIVSLLTMVFTTIIYKQVKKLKAAELRINETNHKLQDTNIKLMEANKIKEEYIGYYFSVNSEYLDKLEAFSTAVEQKLNAKKYDDIRYVLANMNAKRDREELYVSFDKVFVKLFPDFVKTFNSYLKPEEQFILKEDQILNTELRIFALIRMGITDNDDIARILGYSVNTIYAYKTRIRNKSVLANEVFDKMVMEIKAV